MRQKRGHLYIHMVRFRRLMVVVFDSLVYDSIIIVFRSAKNMDKMNKKKRTMRTINNDHGHGHDGGVERVREVMKTNNRRKRRRCKVVSLMSAHCRILLSLRLTT